jgi:hypothetical protein
VRSSKILSIKWVMTVETNVVGLQDIWRIFKCPYPLMF